jgi:hypothetical protein
MGNRVGFDGMRLKWICTALLFVSCASVSAETIRVRVLDARSGRPVSGEKVNVHVQGVRGDVTHTTDGNGTFAVDLSKDAEVGLGTEWRVTCLDKKSKAQAMFSATEILRSGVVEPNTCGKARTELIPGTITIFTRKATFFENMAR